MTLRRKNILLSSVSFLFFIAGILLSSATVRNNIVSSLNVLLNISMDEHFHSIGIYYAGTLLIVSSFILILYIAKINGQLTSNRFYILSSVLVIIHYFFHLSSIAINFPIYDDQGAILDFILRYQNASTIIDKVSLILQPYNESVLAVPKLLVLGWYKIFGEINFRYLDFFNGILLVTMHLFFFFMYFRNWSALFFILTVFLFQYQFYDDAFWAISGLSYYGELLFTGGCICFIRILNRRENFISILFALLAVFTFGNGWLLFPSAIFYLISKKKFRLILPWIAASIVSAVAFYFLRHRFHPISEVHLNPMDNILFILNFLGSSLQFFYSPVIPVMGVIFVISTFVFILLKKKQQVSSFTFFMLGFIILSAIVASPMRSGLDEFGLYGLRVRYGIFSIMALVLCISILAEAFEIGKKKMIIVACSAFLYNMLTGLFFYSEPVIRKENIEVVVEKLKKNDFEIRYTTLDKNDVDNLFREAMAKGIYKP